MGILEGALPKQGDGIVADHPAFPALALTGGLRIPNSTAAPSAAQGAAGAIANGSYNYRYTFVVRNPITDAILAESTAFVTPGGVTITGGPKKVALTDILPAPSDAVNGRRIYRETGGGNYLLIGIIRDNVTTAFSDNAAATTGQPQVPAVNNSGQQALIDVPVGTPSFIGREAGVERFKVDSKGVAQLGAFNPSHPYSYADVVEEISKKIGGTGSPTYTVQSGKILVISAIHGPDFTGSSGLGLFVNQGAGVVTIVHTATAKTPLDWDIRNPVLCDDGDVISTAISTNGTEFYIAGVEIIRTGAIVPIILGGVVQGVSDYTVPADKVFVLLGVGILDSLSFGVKDGASGAPYPVIIEDESLVFDSGGDSIFENKIRTPLVLPAGAIMGGTGLGCSLWGYEVDV